LAQGNREIQQRTILLTEEEFLEIAKKKGLGEWDIEVALGGFRKGVTLDFGGKVKYAIKN
jgi:hypothetical protein